MVQGLDGVHNEHVGLELVDGVHQVLQVGLRQQVEPLPPHPQPLRPQLDLPLRLLPRYIQHLGEAAQIVADLQHQGGLADARRTPHQHQGALHRTPTQHPVQLPHAGGEAQLVGGLHLLHGPGAVDGHPGYGAPLHRPGPLGWLLRRLLHNGVPRLAGRTLPRPLGQLVAAVGTIK